MNLLNFGSIFKYSCDMKEGHLGSDKSLSTTSLNYLQPSQNLPSSFPMDGFAEEVPELKSANEASDIVKTGTQDHLSLQPVSV